MFGVLIGLTGFAGVTKSQGSDLFLKSFCSH